MAKLWLQAWLLSIYASRTAGFVYQRSGGSPVRRKGRQHDHTFTVHVPVAPRSGRSVGAVLVTSSSLSAYKITNGYTYWKEINAAAQAGNAQKAERLFDDMYREYELSREKELRPNAKLFNMLLNAWSKSRSKNAPQRAEAILARMWDLCNIKKLNTKPDMVSYTCVVNCWAKSRLPTASQRAEELLRTMKILSAQQGNEGLLPNSRTFNSVLNAFAQTGDAEKVEALLEEMNEEYSNGNSAARPDFVSYTIVLRAWSKSGSVAAPERAEAILARMWELFNSSKEDGSHWQTKPNAISYTTVLHCWALSRDEKGADRAESLFQEMKRIASDEGDSDLAPNTMSYNAILDAHARRGNAERAEALLEEMYTEYSRGNENTKPDLVSYNSVLNAMSKSLTDKAPERAEIIIKKMWELYESGLFPTKPDAISYTCLIECWAISRRRDAPEQAERLLVEMKKNIKSGIRPNSRTYSSVMKAWSRHSGPQGLARVIILLDEMLTLSAKGDRGVRPDVRTFNLVLAMIAFSGLPDQLERIDMVLGKMEALGVIPDNYTKFAVGKFGRPTTSVKSRH
jgi:pentatricopeptide repeat protein